MTREELRERDNKYALIALIAVGLIIVIGYLIMNKMLVNGKLSSSSSLYNLVNTLGRNEDVWRSSHFILFAILGFAFPDSGILMITLGVLWEICEATLRIKTKCTPIGNECVEWWTSSFYDVVLDVAGFISGRLLRELIDPDRFAI